MREPTKVTSGVLLELKGNSTSHYYELTPNHVMAEFKDLYPNYTGLDILSMRAVLAGDITVVLIKRSHSFELWLTKELDILDEANKVIREKNREIREKKRMREKEILRRLMEGRDSLQNIWNEVMNNPIGGDHEQR